jgi:hypothetical protein
MMTHEQWLNGILSAARHIASKDYQERAWLGGGGREISSPAEIYNELFDDYTFDLFRETYSATFTPTQLVAWDDFKTLMEKYGERVSDNPDPNRVLDDPEWQEVRGAAARFVAAFEQKQPEPTIAGKK